MTLLKQTVWPDAWIKRGPILLKSCPKEGTQNSFYLKRDVLTTHHIDTLANKAEKSFLTNIGSQWVDFNFNFTQWQYCILFQKM